MTADMIDLIEPDKPAAASITPPHILAEAAADQPTAPGAAAAPAAAAPMVADPGAEAADLVEFAFSLFRPLYPSLVPIYAPDVRKRLAAALAPLMAKYHWTMAGFGPEVMFGLAVVPLIQPTIAAIRADRQAAAPAANQVQAAAAVAAETTEKKLDQAFPGLNADAQKKR